MSKEEMDKFLNWIQGKQNQIAKIEKNAKNCLENSDSENYKKLMKEKAEVLADLVDDSLPYLENLPEAQKDFIKQTLNKFSINASEALELNSVFYMSALLYPDDYREGEPNNLEKFIFSLKNNYNIFK